MLGPLKSNSSIDRYLIPLAVIQVVLLITMIFYSFVLVRETAYSHIGHYKFQPEVFQISKAVPNLKKVSHDAR